MKALIDEQLYCLPEESHHELDNEGCKCDLCQKVAIKETHTFIPARVEDLES